MHFDLHLPRARCSRASGLAAAVMVAPWPHACSGVAVLRVCLAVTLAFTWPAFPETDVDRGVKRILDDWEDAEFAELFEGVVPLDIEPEPDEEVTTLVGETRKLAQRVDDLVENWAIQPSELARSALYLTAALITDECPWCGSNDRLVTRVIGLVLHGRIRAHADGVYDYVGRVAAHRGAHGKADQDCGANRSSSRGVVQDPIGTSCGAELGRSLRRFAALSRGCAEPRPYHFDGFSKPRNPRGDFQCWAMDGGRACNSIRERFTHKRDASSLLETFGTWFQSPKTRRYINRQFL